jgi:hypothetical protein
MCDLIEIYSNFLNDISNLSIKNKSDEYIKQISGIMEVIHGISDRELSPHVISLFIKEVSEMYDSIKKKKKLEISDKKSFHYFLKLLDSNPKSSTLLNFCEINSFSLDLPLIANSLKQIDENNYYELYNYVLLLFAESCNFAYPELKSDCQDVSNVPKNVLNQYNMVLDFFEDDMLGNNNIGMNIVEILKISMTNLLEQDNPLYAKFSKVIENPELHVIITDIFSCSLSEDEIEK